jgi:hypothetical protein
MSEFWVYENWTLHKAVFHHGECGACKRGRGQHGGGETKYWARAEHSLRERKQLIRPNRRSPCLLRVMEGYKGSIFERHKVVATLNRSDPHVD